MASDAGVFELGVVVSARIVDVSPPPWVFWVAWRLFCLYRHPAALVVVQYKGPRFIMTHPRTRIEAHAKATGLASSSRAFADSLDAQDELAKHRTDFHIPKHKGEDVVYLCGNSLGLMHKGVDGSMAEFTRKWRESAINGHWEEPMPWFELDECLNAPMAKLMGALPSEVVVMNTLTVNLHLLLCAFYRPEGNRRKILIEKNPFPSDMYAIRSQLRMRGCDMDADLIEVGLEDEVKSFDQQAILDIIEKRGDEIAVILISGVHFLTGQVFDMKAITEAGHRKGCYVGFDLAHAAGNLDLKLHDWNVDFACWCTYKYLNAGPGNIAGAFIHKNVDVSKLHRLEGWWGHARTGRFHLKHDFEGSLGAASFQLSNPGVGNIMALRPALEAMAEVGIDKLRAKSVLLTGYMEYLMQELLPNDIQILSPANIEERGCQLSVRVVGELVSEKIEGKEYECGTNTNNKASILQKQLEANGIVCDNRPPDILRLPPVPMYNSFADVHKLCTTLRVLIQDRKQKL